MILPPACSPTTEHRENNPLPISYSGNANPFGSKRFSAGSLYYTYSLFSFIHQNPAVRKDDGVLGFMYYDYDGQYQPPCTWHCILKDFKFNRMPRPY